MSSVGTRSAYGRRQHLRTKARHRIHGLLHNRQATAAIPADYLHFVPGVRSDAELSELSARVNWYLPNVSVPIYVEGAIKRRVEPQLAPAMDPALVRDPGWTRHRPPGRAHVVLHRLTPAALTAFLRADASTLAAADLFRMSERGYFQLGTTYSTASVPDSRTSADRLLARGEGARSAFVLATGPSASMIDPSEITADVRITCNSAVRDADLIRELRPDVLAFADPVFQFGPSRYAAAFRRDLLRAAEESDALFVSTNDFVHPLLDHEPALADRFAVLPIGGSEWRWPDELDASVRGTGNILTIMMLPCAFAVADEVAIAGADGRKPSESYYWQHDKKRQYSSDLMQSVFDAHPAFFRDVDYEDYYDRHCAQLEEFLSAAESRGKKISGMTPSWIPALRKRGAPVPEQV